MIHITKHSKRFQGKCKCGCEWLCTIGDCRFEKIDNSSAPKEMNIAFQVAVAFCKCPECGQEVQVRE